MSNIARDGVIVRKVIIGLLAASSTGVALYYGYTRWKTRSESCKAEPKEKTELPQSTKAKELNLQGPTQPDPTPVVQSKSTPNGKLDHESLSVSGTFEKISLPPSSDDSHIDKKNIVESFENVSIPEAGKHNNKVQKDSLPVSTTQSDSDKTETGSSTGGKSQNITDPPPRSRTEMKVNIPTPVKPEPAKSTISSVTIPQSPAKTVTKSDDDEEEDSDEEEKEDDEEEGASDSDASGDSQKKDGEASPTLTASPAEPMSPFYDLTSDKQLFADVSKVTKEATQSVAQEPVVKFNKSHSDVEISKITPNTTPDKQVMPSSSLPVSPQNADNKLKSPDVSEETKSDDYSSDESVYEDSLSESSHSAVQVLEEPTHVSLVSESPNQPSGSLSHDSVSSSQPSEPSIDKSGSPSQPSEPFSQSSVSPKEPSGAQTDTTQGSIKSVSSSGSLSSTSASVSSTSVLSSRKSSTTSVEDNINSTLQHLQRCMLNCAEAKKDQKVLVGHPGQPGKYIDLGMTMDNTKGNLVASVDEEGLARDCSIRAGDEIMTINNMAVTRWNPDVLLQLFANINNTEFELSLENESSKMKNLIRHITINIAFDKSTVKVKPIVVEKSSANQLASPVELGTFTPKACYIQKPGTDLCLMVNGARIGIEDKNEDTAPFEMMRLLFTRAHSKGYQIPVTMLAFYHDDVIGYISVIDRNTLILMSQKNLRSGIDALDVADCRFFNHRTLAGFDCFESTLMPDHYLSYEAGKVCLKHIGSPKMVGQQKSVHFIVNYKTGK